MTFIEIDEKLHMHERAFYRACAGGAHFDITHQWQFERERLTALWLAALRDFLRT